MSRVGKKIINIPVGVQVILEGGKIVVEGAKGVLSFKLPAIIMVEIIGDTISVSPVNCSRAALSMWGMVRMVINNFIIGVSAGFEKIIDIVGVGYKAQVSGDVLTLSLGYSTDKKYQIPSSVSIRVSGQKQDQLVVSGIDCQVVGQVADDIRAFRMPEPYKGKGIVIRGKHVFRKENKKK